MQVEKGKRYRLRKSIVKVLLVYEYKGETWTVVRGYSPRLKAVTQAEVPANHLESIAP